jgi:hypothetical protein
MALKLAARGMDIIITYHSQKEDALQVMNEINTSLNIAPVKYIVTAVCHRLNQLDGGCPSQIFLMKV